MRVAKSAATAKGIARNTQLSAAVMPAFANSPPSFHGVRTGWGACATIRRPSPNTRRAPMKVANAVAEILKREGIEFLIGYPVNPIIEAAAEADIRTIMVRQERIGLHMCDAIAKVTSGDKIGVFAMQHGPGHRKRVRRRGPVLRRFLPGGRAPGRLRPRHQPGPAELQRRAQLPQRYQMDRAGDGAARHRRGVAPRLHPGQERPPRAGADRIPVRPVARGDQRAARLSEDAAAEERPRPALGLRDRRGLGRGRSARSSSPARASITPRPGRNCKNSPSCWKRRS